MTARERSAGWRLLAAGAAPVVGLLGRIRVEGAEHLPDGPVVIAPNHVSDLDPLLLAWVVWRAGRVPRFLAKESLFEVPGLGWLMRATGQIPVDRTGRTRSSDPLGAGEALVGRGLAVIVYPEGTLTRDPDYWPMRGKTGAVRMALDAGAPVVPLAQWGAQRILPRWTKRLRILPRRTARYRFGPPVDLDEFRSGRIDQAGLQRATGVVMAAITHELERLRGQTAPAERWNPAEHGQTEYGRVD